MLCLWFFGLLLMIKNKKFNTNIIIILSLFLIIPFTGLLNMLFSDQSVLFLNSIKTTLHKLFYIIPLGALYYSTIDRRSYPRFVIFILLIILFVMIIQFFQFQMNVPVYGFEPTHPSFKNAMGSLAIKLKDYITSGDFRPPSVFSEPSDAGMFAVFLGLPLLGLKNISKRIIFFIISLIGIIIILSRSLAPLLAFLICILVYIKNNFKGRTFLFFVVPIIILITFTFSFRIGSIIRIGDPSYVQRISTVKNSLIILNKSEINMLFGFGMGNNSKFKKEISGGSIKSDYIRYLFDGGFAGFTLYIFFLLILYFKSIRGSPLRYFILSLGVIGILGDTQALYYLFLFFAIAYKLSVPYYKEKKYLSLRN
jgi:hypothetical protein